MHGNQWVLKIAVLKYYSVSKRGTTAKSNPKQATDPISLHTKFGDNSSNTFPLNERKPCVTPDIGRRTSDGAKSKNNISTPQGGGHNSWSHHDVAHLHPLTNVPTKYQLPTPYSFRDIARTRFSRSRSLRQGQIKVRP